VATDAVAVKHLVAGLLALGVLTTSGAGVRADVPTRGYLLHVPAPVAAGGGVVPLVVYLHGCNQTAADAELGTRFSAVADERGFVVVYPEQSRDLGDGNGSGCWNWFRPEHQQRGAGEPAALAAITEHVIATQPVDPDRVYVVGASAGADMAAILGATYPDLYAAIGVLAGCAYPTCADVTGVVAHAAMGEHARPVPTLVAQGTADVLNNAAMGAGAVQQWIGTDDLADDGEANGSVARRPSSSEQHDATLGQPGSGDACIRSNRFPCLGGLAGLDHYPYTVERYDSAAGCTLVEHWLVQGLGHAYPGGDPRGSFTDPLGPEITEALVDFFLAHPRTPTGC